jgi:AcrR family transcriptional regulator
VAVKKSKRASQLPQKNQEKRQIIVEIVVRILANEGIEKFSFENVASAIGMTRQNLLYYFKSRDEMIAAAVMASSLSGQQITEDVVKQAKKTPRDLLQAVVEATSLWEEKLPDHARVYCLFYYLSTIDPKYAAMLAEVVRVGRSRIIDIIALYPVSKRPKEYSISKLAELIHSIIFGRGVYQLLAKGSVFNRNEYTRATMGMIDALLCVL